MITETLKESPAGRSPVTAAYLSGTAAAALYCGIFIPDLMMAGLV